MVKNRQKVPAVLALQNAVTKMAPAILTALLAAGLGFISLYTSPVPMIQDFGKMLTIGMIISFFVALFLLVPILFTRDRFFIKKEVNKGKRSNRESKFEKVIGRLTKKTFALRWVVIVLALITSSLGIWFDLDSGVETDVETFMPQDTPELKDIHILRGILGTTDQVTILFEGKDLFNKNSIVWVDKITAGLQDEFPETVVDSKSFVSIVKQMNEGTLPYGRGLEEIIEDMPEDQLKMMLNDTGTKGVITVGIKHLEAGELKAFIKNLNAYLKENQTEELETTVTGKSVLDVEMVSALTMGRYKMTLLGMGLVFLGLLAIYRHPVKAFIPLLPIVLIIGWSGGLMSLIGMDYTPLTATLGALIIGVGTEFTILIMERFYEERKKGISRMEAIVTANRKIGTAIFASALTTVGGFSALLASDFVILNNFGMMTLINISLALLSTTIVMPAILVILDRFVQTGVVEEGR